ncbi:SEC-C domain-containing protein [Sphingomonas sanguinis]|uniref:SEC-C domain-containing protein n=1 Tax=Sphingomonas sanguinis TaxID=33051 RepID=A0ABU5LV79_9SPHN|nr:SEC-C domain-containing protein [Sphingomonas sanguinis]MDZ7283835.1 SEC-C domain-containing protein [Sphingomonas sanguinis]
MMAATRPLNVPRRTDPCLCGSGKPFRECCRDHLPGRQMGETWQEPARKKQWPKVLRCLRADLTQYTIYHRTNTVPLMRMMPPEEIEILSIDIEALHESVDQLAGAYWELRRLDEFPAVLERLRPNVDDPRWQRKVTYHQAMTAHLLDDTLSACRELAKLGAIGPDEADVDVLQLHLDINGKAIPLVDKLRFYDRILALTSSRRDRIHYETAKAVELILADDRTGAAATVRAGLAAARESEMKDAFYPDTELSFAKLLEVAGMATRERALFVEAAERLMRLLAMEDHWTPAGRGHIAFCLGEVLRIVGRWEEGAGAYRIGFDLDGNPACRIFEASCLLMCNRKEDAVALIETVSFDDLDVPEQSDYAIAYAMIAIGLRDVDRLDDAAAKLKTVTPIRQYFANENLRYQVEIERARATIAAGQPVAKSSRLLDWISSASRWFMIQPNVAGIGINVNAIVDDAVASHRRKRKPHDRGGEDDAER